MVNANDLWYNFVLFHSFFLLPYFLPGFLHLITFSFNSFDYWVMTVCKDCNTDIMHWIHYAMAGIYNNFSKVYNVYSVKPFWVNTYP